MSDIEKKGDKSGVAHGGRIVCPTCSNTHGPFQPDFRPGIVVFTCPQCYEQFDADGNSGPFTVRCCYCGMEQPRKNTTCYWCKKDLSISKEAQEFLDCVN